MEASGGRGQKSKRGPEVGYEAGESEKEGKPWDVRLEKDLTGRPGGGGVFCLNGEAPQGARGRT